MVEDDEVTAMALEAHLRDLGLAPRSVGTGEAALVVVETCRPALILMDWDLPGIDGLATARALRATGLDVPIVAVTGKRDPGAEAACLGAGMDGYLPKPVTRWGLTATLRRHLGARTA
jgi:CheY-like chemotaxis protein